MDAAKFRHSIELPSINQWRRTTSYNKPCVSDTSGVYSMVCEDLARVMHVCIGTSVDAVQNIYYPELNTLKSVGLIRLE